MMDPSGKVPKDGAKQSQGSPSQENVRNFGNFEFWNGDKYEGQYLAVKQQLSIVRNGQGAYWTTQSVYIGKWNQDLLEKADQITFCDKSIFIGTLENMMLDGPGIYKFEEGVEIHGKLKKNYFFGDVELKDPNDHCWKALNPPNTDKILFSPIQPFWQSVLSIKNFILPYSQAQSEE